jgi:hypothetical protein
LTPITERRSLTQSVKFVRSTPPDDLSMTKELLNPLSWWGTRNTRAAWE